LAELAREAAVESEAAKAPAVEAAVLVVVLVAASPVALV